MHVSPTNFLYRDFAQKTVHEVIQHGIEVPQGKRKGPRGGVTTPFPVKLAGMLELAEAERFQDIVSWLPHGRGFAIHNPEHFATSILPR